MKKLTLLFLCVASLVASAQVEKDPVIMEVNNKKVYKSEFEQIFWKNKKENVTNQQELDEYLDLFIKFKLKVEAAQEAGLDTTKKFVNEFNGYKIQLQKPYLVDTSVNEKLIQEAYNRTVNEIRASHLLIKVAPDAEPKDTLNAYNGIMKVRSEIEKGKITFEEAAIKYSEDESVKSNNGDLGYFSAFRMVYPFEDAAYKTEEGTVSMPFRTQFGYHLVYPTAHRKSRGKVKVAHIMVRVRKDATDQDEKNAEQKINEIYEKLNAGEDFAELVRDYSDDRNSVRRNGELEWVEAGRYFQEFEDASFSLKEDGEYTKPVKSPAGWHIIKRIEFKPVDNLENLRIELKNKIQRDPLRAEKTKTSFVNKLKNEYAYVASPKNLDKFMKSVDETIENNNWNADYAKDMTAEIFNYAGKSVSQYDFAKYLERSQNFKKGNERSQFLKDKYNQFVTETLTEFEKTRLEEKYPAYKALLQEYRDGILLFEINDQKVWSYAIKDTAGLNAYYQEHMNEHMWKARTDARIFTSKDKKTIKKAYKLVKKGELRNDSIVNLLNQDSQLNISFESGRYEEGENEYLKSNEFKLGVNKPVMLNDKYVLIVIDKELPSAPKKLNEAKGAYTAAYQDFLEQKWIEELEAKYPVTVNKDVLYSIKKKP